MTQQQISRILDISDRTLRDWKKSRKKLYTLLETLNYEEIKEKTNLVDINDIVIFNPNEFSYNLFWQTNKESKQKVYSIISNYLSTMNTEDIKTLCNKFGKNIVINVLKHKYKNIYKKGFISTKGLDIPLSGKYKDNAIYKQILEIIND